MVKTGVIFIGLLMGLLLLWERNTLVHMGLEIRELEREEKALLQEHHELLVEIASLSSYRRIERIAMRQMGMIHPAAHQLVMVLADQPAKRKKDPEMPADLKRFAHRKDPNEAKGLAGLSSGGLGGELKQAGMFPLKRSR